MIDLCVTNYNTPLQLQRLVDTLHSDAQAYARPWRLYIADNGSTDDSLWHMSRWAADSPNWDGKTYFIEAVLQNNNVGYAAACNQLASYGSSPIIGLLNADIWLTTSDILRIEQQFKNPDVAILGPKQRDEAGRITHAGIFGTQSAPKMRGWKEHDPHDLLYRNLEECVTVAGSAYFIRREVWDVLSTCVVYKEQFPEAEGAFMPTPHYYEETYCSYHAHAHGFKVFYDGNTSIGHSWHASAPQGQGRDGYWQVSQKMFREACDKHGIDHD